VTPFDIRGVPARGLVATLSGGNLQKIVGSRELSGDPALVVATQHIRGLDAGAGPRVLPTDQSGNSTVVSDASASSDRFGFVFIGDDVYCGLFGGGLAAIATDVNRVEEGVVVDLARGFDVDQPPRAGVPCQAAVEASCSAASLAVRP
jgi:hypothetical protein